MKTKYVAIGRYYSEMVWDIQAFTGEEHDDVFNEFLNNCCDSWGSAVHFEVTKDVLDQLKRLVCQLEDELKEV